MCHVRVAETIARLNQQRVDFGDDALGVAAGAGAGVAGDFDGALRALAAVDGEAESEAIVALRDRFFGAFQGVGGGVQLGGRVLRGAGRFSGGDGALRLIHFFARRLGAGGG